jgi:hypothetical protein
MKDTTRKIPGLPRGIFPVIGVVCVLASVGHTVITTNISQNYADGAMTNTQIIVSIIVGIVPTLTLLMSHIHLHEKAFEYANSYFNMREAFTKHLNGLMELMPSEVPEYWVVGGDEDEDPKHWANGIWPFEPITSERSIITMEVTSTGIIGALRHYTHEVTERTNELVQRFEGPGGKTPPKDWGSTVSLLGKMTYKHAIPLAQYTRAIANIMLANEQRVDEEGADKTHVYQTSLVSRELGELNARFQELCDKDLIPEALVAIEDRQMRLGHFLKCLLANLPAFLAGKDLRIKEIYAAGDLTRKEATMLGTSYALFLLWEGYPKRGVSEGQAIEHSRGFIRAKRLEQAREFVHMLSDPMIGDEIERWLKKIKPEMIREVVADLQNKGELIDGQGNQVHPHGWRLIAYAGVKVAESVEGDDLPRDPTDVP